MAEFVIKAADERGHMLQQVENGYSEAEIRERWKDNPVLPWLESSRP